MLLTENDCSTTTTHRGFRGQYALRIHDAAGERIVDLPNGKLTIGSGPRCGVRIAGAGTQPLHCLVVNDASGLSVRRWAPGALLNGGPFDIAELSIGDFLLLGPVRLEVVGKSTDEESSPADTERGADRLSAEHGPNLPAIDDIQPVAPSFTWGNDTVHHTTVWVGEDEGDAAPQADEPQEVETLESFASEPPLERLSEQVELLPADAAREVYRQLQAANAVSRARCRKLLATLRTNRDTIRDLSAQLQGLTNTKDELVAQHDALSRERASLDEQLAEVQRRCAEFEHQSLEWEQTRRDFEKARDDWEHERTEKSQHLRVQETRIATLTAAIDELKSQLAEATARSAGPAQSSVPSGGEQRGTSWSAGQPQATSAPIVGADNQASSPARELAPDEFAPSAEDSHSIQRAVALAPNAGNVAEAAEAPGPAWESEPPVEEPAWERHTPAWEIEPSVWEAEPPSHLVGEPHRNLAENEGEDENELPTTLETDAVTANLKKPSEPAVSASPADSPAGETADIVAPIAPDQRSSSLPAEKKRQPISYIERFSHLFADEGHSPDVASAPTAAPTDVSHAGTDKSRSVLSENGSNRDLAGNVSKGEEESIEEYMAKLMLRVRGERPPGVTLQAESTAPLPQGEAATANQAAATLDLPRAIPPATPTCLNPDEKLADSLEQVRKKPSMEQPTNLEALRALANESARRAIGAHATKKHRGDAVTKFIVASLAGMTSLWLMLLAPSWRDVQFIVGCVSLLVAAYWAGQAYAKLVEMHNAAEYGQSHRPGGEMDRE